MLSPHVPAVLFEIVIPVIAGAAIASGLNASAASSNMPCKTDWFEMCVLPENQVRIMLSLEIYAYPLIISQANVVVK